MSRHHKKNTATRRAAAAAAAIGLATTAMAQVAFEETGEQLTLAGAFFDARAILYADMNNDGSLDVIVGSFGTSMRIWLNNGSGSYSDSGFRDDQNANRVNQLLIEDFDNDGYLDILAVRGAHKPSTLWLSDGSGGHALSSQTLPTGTYAAAGDLDGDGNIDVVFGTGEVYFNDGAGQLSEVTSLTGQNGAVDIGDLDGDGHADILVVGGVSGEVYFNDGGSPPVFGSPRQEPVIGSRSVELVDLDGDGSLDALTNAGVYINDGNGDFSRVHTWSGGVSQAITADVDQDGDMDVALALQGPSFSEAPNELWINDGNASFSNSGLQLGPANWALSVAFGDFDGDSDPDLIFGTAGNDYVYQHENLTDAWRFFHDRFESN